jgi:hypothetical protein
MALWSSNTHASGANAAITLAAIGENGNVEIEAIAWSYSAAPTGGRLTVTSDGVTLLDVDITAGGPGMLDFSGSCLASKNGKSLIITLYDGSVTNKLAVGQRFDGQGVVLNRPSGA